MNNLGLLWQHLEPDLQRTLYGCYRAHGIISTRRAVACMRDDLILRATLAKMHDQLGEAAEVPGPELGAPKASLEDATKPGNFENMQCSPCVLAAAAHFLPHVGHYESRISAVEFFRVSIGPTAQAWRDNGMSSERISTLIKETSESGYSEQCSICMERAKDVALDPCGHLGFCSQCADILVQKKTVCPICRTAITKAIKIYRT